MAKLLVVDDEKNVLEMVAYILEKDGHAVKVCDNGQAALDHVAVEKPDMIVLDVMMPVIDGYTVCSTLASADDTKEIPILVLTAKGQMRDVFEMSPNVSAYLEKPFDPNELRRQVSKVLEKLSR